MAGIRPVTREISGRCHSGGVTPGWYHSMLTTDWSWAGTPGGLYGLFQEMEDKDAHLFATLQTRKNALLGCPWKVIAGDDSTDARAAAALVERNLFTLPSLNMALFHLLDAVAKGFAVAEIIWEVDRESGHVYAADIRGRNQVDFAFDSGQRLFMLNDTPATDGSASRPHLRENMRDLLPRPGETMVWAQGAQAMPERKFLHFAFQGNTCSPYGAALCIKAYQYYWLKKNTLQHWALFNEKFGSPTAVARYAATTSEDDLRRLEETIASLPQDTGVLLPEGVGLEFLEARRASGSNTYREMADWCNDEISKIVLGQTLTTSEGRRSGSLALGQVHETVRRDYLASDAAIVGQVLSSQLARWITDFNFGTDVPAPRVVFDVAPPEQFESELAVDRELIKMGVPIPAAYFYDRYRRPAPRDGERTLRYDDANLYQYHLLHGVLTINEVRATLGLAATPWGDQQTGRRGGGESAAVEQDMGGRGGGRDGDRKEGDGDADEATADRQLG